MLTVSGALAPAGSKWCKADTQYTDKFNEKEAQQQVCQTGWAPGINTACYTRSFRTRVLLQKFLNR